MMFALTLMVAAFLAADDAPATPAAADKPIDYRQTASWAARGDRSGDACDVTVGPYTDQQSSAEADTFYVYPTVHGLEDYSDISNADITTRTYRRDVAVALATQATAFTDGTRIWAPYYRQASMGSFGTSYDTGPARAVHERAYADMLAAFDHYMANENNGRPIVLAGHSQGGTWLVRLLKERFDGKKLSDQLVAAYIMGEFIGPDTFDSLPLCTNGSDTGCVLSWATVAKGGTPRDACGSKLLSSACTSSPINTTKTPVATNPLTWTTTSSGPTDNTQLAINSGPFDGEFVEHWLSAWCDGGVVRIDDTVDGGFWVGTLKENLADYVKHGDYHFFDVELFFGNLRENVPNRVAAFRAKASHTETATSPP